MKIPAMHRVERARQETVNALDLGTPTLDQTYQAVVDLLGDAMNTPIALFSVIDGDRQLFKANKGLDASETPRDISFCGHAILQEDSELFVVGDAQRDERFADNPLVTGDPKIRFYAGAVVMAPNNLPVGTVCAIDREPRKLTAREGGHLRCAKLLMEASISLRAQSVRDHLTGLYNRRYFDESLAREWRRAYRYAVPMGVLLFDVDHFKAYNDKFGHQAGDDCLKKVAEALKGVLSRGGDLVARYGGEEFVAVLPSTPLDAVEKIADRMRQAVRGLAIESAAGGVVTISAGGGVAIEKAHLVGGPEALLSLADEALYEAKDAGRDRCIVRGAGGET